jgi:hypothetical protein
LGGALIVVAVIAPRIGLVEPTEAAWTDRVLAGAGFGSSRWATSGNATATVLSTSLTVAILLTGTIGPVGPALSSSADQTHPGPDAKTNASVSSPGLLLGVVSGSVSATSASTTAGFTPTLVTSASNLTGLNVGLTALGLPLLTNLVTLSSASGNGLISSTAQCRSTATSTAANTALTDLRVGLLGGPAAGPTIVGNTATANTVQLTAANLAQVTVGVTITPTSTAVSVPANPTASASLTATIALTVDQRLTTLVGFSTTLSVGYVIPITTAGCAMNLP